MAYPSTADLIAASSGEARAALDALDGTQQDGLRAGAIAAVEEFCGQKFDNEVLERKLDGSGGDSLELPRRLAELTAIDIAGSSLDFTSVGLSDDHARLLIVRPSVSTAYLRLLEQIDRPVRVFTFGRQTVAVSGVWGWADGEFPGAVKTALQYDMEDQALGDANSLASTVRAYQRLGLRDISQGNLRAAFTGSVGLSVRAQTPLLPHVWTPAGVVV